MKNMMVCSCGSKNIDVEKNIGYDVWENGEENQHIDICLDCNAWRMHFDVVYFDEVNEKWINQTKFGKWTHDKMWF